MNGFSKIFFISDFLFPIWLVVLIVILRRKGFSTWKAWGLASTLCLVQAYLVAKLIGWNLGGYFIAFISSAPFMLFCRKKVSDDVLLISFWILPPILFVIIPTIILYLLTKAKKSQKELTIR